MSDDVSQDAQPNEWGLVRALAHGSPLDTAPDHIWRSFAEAMRQYAREVLAAHLWSERAAHRVDAGDVPKPDEDGCYTRTPAGGLHYHAYDPATEDDDDGLDGAPRVCESCGFPLSNYARDMGYRLCKQCAGE